MKTQISVDWLIEQHEKLMRKYVYVMLIKDSQYHDLKNKLIQTARKMHREEVVNSFTKGQLDLIEVIMPIPDEIKVDTEDGENYYTQTFETP